MSQVKMKKSRLQQIIKEEIEKFSEKMLSQSKQPKVLAENYVSVDAKLILEALQTSGMVKSLAFIKDIAQRTKDPIEKVVRAAEQMSVLTKESVEQFLTEQRIARRKRTVNQ